MWLGVTTARHNTREERAEFVHLRIKHRHWLFLHRHCSRPTNLERFLLSTQNVPQTR
jgi:hypothetical protein